MSFEKYIQAVIGYYVQGGTTWEASYWRVLQQLRPDVASMVDRAGFNPTAPYVPLGDFIHYAYANWEAK